jgi:glucose-1-phosphate thymidylyltransferase
MSCKGIITVAAVATPSKSWLDATRSTALQRVANRPIVCHVLDALNAAGVNEIAVVTPPSLAEEIFTCVESDRRGEQIQYFEHDPRGEDNETLAALARFADGKATIVHRANGLLAQPLAPFIALLDHEPTGIVLLVTQGARNTEQLGSSAREVLRVTELDSDNATLGLAGICMLGPGALDGLLRLDRTWLDMEALVESQIQHGSGHVQVRLVHEHWRAFNGNPLDLLDLNRAVLDTLRGETTPVGEGNRFEGRIVVHPTASVSSSVICGPVIIGAEAYITDSYIGPHTSIGERVHIEGAEIERSIVLAGASILHVGGRLVASLVGRDARVFRDFSMPRAMRLQVGDGDEVALC